METVKLEDVMHRDDLAATLLTTVRLDDGKRYFCYGINGCFVVDMGWMLFPENIGRAAADKEAQALLDETVRRLRVEMSPLKMDSEFTVIDKRGVYGHRF